LDNVGVFNDARDLSWIVLLVYNCSWFIRSKTPLCYA